MNPILTFSAAALGAAALWAAALGAAALGAELGAELEAVLEHAPTMMPIAMSRPAVLFNMFPLSPRVGTDVDIGGW